MEMLGSPRNLHNRGHVRTAAGTIFRERRDPDAKLCSRAGHGFRVVVRKTCSAAVALFFRNTADAALADDLSQDLWFAVVDSAASYEVRSKFTTWLFTMAHHRLVDHWRRRKPGLSLSADTEESLRLADSLFAASGFEPDHSLDRQLMAQLLLDALAGLPAEQRECFCCRWRRI